MENGNNEIKIEKGVYGDDAQDAAMRLLLERGMQFPEGTYEIYVAYGILTARCHGEPHGCPGEKVEFDAGPEFPHDDDEPFTEDEIAAIIANPDWNLDDPRRLI